MDSSFADLHTFLYNFTYHILTVLTTLRLLAERNIV